MPIYTYKCLACDAPQDLNKKIAERDNCAEEICKFCATKNTLERQVDAPLVAYSIAVNGGYGSAKHASGFNEVLKKIHQRAPGSRLDKTSTFMN